MNILVNKLNALIKPWALANSPSFSVDKAVALFSQFATPFLSFVLIVIPTITAISCGIMFIKDRLSDENEQQQKPLGPRISKVIGWAVAMELITAILDVFGLVVK